MTFFCASMRLSMVCWATAAREKSRNAGISMRRSGADYSAVLAFLAGCFSRSSICRASYPLSRALPNFGHELFARLVEDIAVVNHQFGGFSVRRAPRPFAGPFGFVRVSQLEEHPRMGVQIVGLLSVSATTRLDIESARSRSRSSSERK